MHVCFKHDCAHKGVCEACNWEARAKEAESDLQGTRWALLQKERECDAAVQECARLQAAQACCDKYHGK
jgi:hypothetical protein